MSDLQHELSQSLDLDDLNLSDMTQDDTVEGNIRLDLQPETRNAPLTDVRITLVTGRAHPKHTEGGDFRQAFLR